MKRNVRATVWLITINSRESNSSCHCMKTELWTYLEFLLMVRVFTNYKFLWRTQSSVILPKKRRKKKTTPQADSQLHLACCSNAQVKPRVAVLGFLHLQTKEPPISCLIQRLKFWNKSSHWLILHLLQIFCRCSKLISLNFTRDYQFKQIWELKSMAQQQIVYCFVTLPQSKCPKQNHKKSRLREPTGHMS